MSSSFSRDAGVLFRPFDTNAVAAAFTPHQDGGAVGVDDLPAGRVRPVALQDLLRAGRLLARLRLIPETMLHARARGEQLNTMWYDFLKHKRYHRQSNTGRIPNRTRHHAQ
jgi:hypothetical protein